MPPPKASLPGQQGGQRKEEREWRGKKMQEWRTTKACMEGQEER